MDRSRSRSIALGVKDRTRPDFQTLVAGSHHTKSRKTLAQPSEIKTKAKWKWEDTPGDSSTDLEDSDSPPHKQSTHGGRCAGAGNYQEQDLKALLKYTEKVLPIGQWGWKKVYEKYASWVNANGRPVHEWKNLENKFKNVHHPQSIVSALLTLSIAC